MGTCMLLDSVLKSRRTARPSSRCVVCLGFALYRFSGRSLPRPPCVLQEVSRAADTVNSILRLVPKYVNAFLNTDGGRILFGVADDGTVVGLPFDRKQKDILRLRVDAAIDSFRPQVDPDLWSLRFIPAVSASNEGGNAEDDDDDDMIDPPAVPTPPVEPLITPASLATTPAPPRNGGPLVFIEVPHSAPIQIGAPTPRPRALSISTPGSSPFGTPILAEGPTSLYVIELAVMRGRAPIYFTTVRGKGSKAYIRLDGSVHEMTEGLYRRCSTPPKTPAPFHTTAPTSALTRPCAQE